MTRDEAIIAAADLAKKLQRLTDAETKARNAWFNRIGARYAEKRAKLTEAAAPEVLAVLEGK